MIVNAYGDSYPFSEIAQTIVKGSNVLLIKVFDDSVKEEVMKSLARSEMDLEY